MTFRTTLKHWMAANKHSEPDVCRLLGVSTWTVQGWLSGKSQPANSRAAYLAKMMGLDERELMKVLIHDRGARALKVLQ